MSSDEGKLTAGEGIRITVTLTRRAATELDALVADTGLSKTDLINRAIGLYQFVTNRAESGWQIALTRGDKEVLVHLQ